MSNIEIYHDDKMTIEIDEFFHNYVQENCVKTITLSKIQYNLILEIVLRDLTKNKHFEIKGTKPISSSHIPIFEHNKIFDLVNDFEVLSEASYYLSILEDRSNKGEIKEALNGLYENKELPFAVEFFDKPLFQVNGYLAAIDNKKLLIVLFSYPE